MADLQHAGFIELPHRGKGSHSLWRHPSHPDIPVVTLAGQLADDAKPYQERDVRNVLAQVKDGNNTMGTRDNALRYSILIRWSDEDQLYIAEVPELPGCKTHGATYEDAVAQAQDAIAAWIYGHRASGYPIPQPAVYHAADRSVSRPLR
jgi:predicted RNase H-like HicB family nuclease